MEHHVGISDLGNGGKVEDDGKQKDEACDGEIDPLDVLDCICIVADLLKKDVGAQNRSNDGAYSIERLSEVDADLRVPWWAAHCLVSAGLGRERIREAGAYQQDRDLQPSLVILTHCR